MPSTVCFHSIPNSCLSLSHVPKCQTHWLLVVAEDSGRPCLWHAFDLLSGTIETINVQLVGLLAQQEI